MAARTRSTTARTMPTPAMPLATAYHHLGGRTSWSLTTGGGGGAGMGDTACMGSCCLAVRTAGIGDVPGRCRRAGEALSDQRELVVRLHDRDAHVTRSRLAVELPGRHDGAGGAGEPPGQPPGV